MADTRPTIDIFRVRIEKARSSTNLQWAAMTEREIAVDLLVEILVTLRRIEEKPHG